MSFESRTRATYRARRVKVFTEDRRSPGHIKKKTGDGERNEGVGRKMQKNSEREKKKMEKKKKEGAETTRCLIVPANRTDELSAPDEER